MKFFCSILQVAIVSQPDAFICLLTTPDVKYGHLLELIFMEFPK